MTLKHVIEALVFASPKPLLTKEIVAALRAAGEGTEDLDAQSFAKMKEAEVLAALAEIEAELTASDRAFRLVERVNGWTLVSDPACAVWVRQLYPEAKPTRLTGPQLETLAIIAYRQPVTRADCEAVRGVAVDGVMQILLDRGLVKIAGRAEVPGRPLLYSTTEYFLQHFGLKTTDELPNASELKRVVLPTAKVEEPAATPEAATTPEEPAASAEIAETPENSEAPPESPESDGTHETNETDESPAPEEAEAPAGPEPADEQSPAPELAEDGGSEESDDQKPA
jgi:segregation and condensation protein B